MSRDTRVEDLIAELQELRLQQGRALEELHSLVAQTAPQTTLEDTVTRVSPVPTFIKGQRVHLKSKGRFFQSNRDRYATVKHFDASTNRVYVRTDANTHTWRAPKNLVLLRTEPSYNDNT